VQPNADQGIVKEKLQQNAQGMQDKQWPLPNAEEYGVGKHDEERGKRREERFCGRDMHPSNHPSQH
jgi:hypothetical protein